MLAKFRKNKKTGKTGHFKEIFFSLLAGTVLIFSISLLLKANISVDKNRDKYLSQIESLKKEIEKAEKKKADLEKAMAQAGTREYLEKIAREQLGMKNPGEEVIVISREEDKNLTPSSDSENQEKNFWDPQYWWEWLMGK